MHPTLSRYITRLAGLSSAKTSKGVLAFVRKHPECLKDCPKKTSVAEWKAAAESRKWESEPVRNSELEERATKIAVNNPVHTRKSNWYTAVPRVHFVSLGSVCTASFRYKGKFSGYSGFNYFPEYNSYFRVALKEVRKRKELEKALQDPKKLAKIWVTRDDSLASGNCQAGTDRFIETAFRESSGIGAARADWLIEKWPTPAVVSAVRRALLRSL